MPKDPKGRKRPADVISNAVHVMRIATGEIKEPRSVEDGKNQAAAALVGVVVKFQEAVVGQFERPWPK